MGKKYLITGGSGFIGSALVKRMLKEGDQIRVLDNGFRGSPERLKDVADQIELVNGDIRDPVVVQKACSGVDSVIHLAFVNGTELFYTKPELVLDVGVKGIVNIIDSCIQQGIKELLVASSSEVYQIPPVVPTHENVPLVIPDPLNPRYSYAGGKIISELMALNYGRKYFDRVVIFRPHNVYGPDMGWEHVVPQFILRMNELAKSPENPVNFPIQGTGKETRAFTFIDDFVDGLMHVIRKGEHMEIYHVGTMDEISIENIALQIAKQFGKDIVIVPGEKPKGSTHVRCPDITKIRKFGFSQKVPFVEGLKKTIEWYVANADKKPDYSNGGVFAEKKIRSVENDVRR